MSIIGPFSVMFTYRAAAHLNSQTSMGPMNPFVALQLWFWGMEAYNSIDDPIGHPDQTRFSYMNYGSYAWIYVVAPFGGALLGGLMASIYDR